MKSQTFPDHDRILEVSRTLAGKKNISGNEILERVQVRSRGRQLFE
jgi:hypothetical protein